MLAGIYTQTKYSNLMKLSFASLRKHNHLEQHDLRIYASDDLGQDLNSVVSIEIHQTIKLHSGQVLLCETVLNGDTWNHNFGCLLQKSLEK